MLTEENVIDNLHTPISTQAHTQLLALQQMIDHRPERGSISVRFTNRPDGMHGAGKGDGLSSSPANVDSSARNPTFEPSPSPTASAPDTVRGRGASLVALPRSPLPT